MCLKEKGFNKSGSVLCLRAADTTVGDFYQDFCAHGLGDGEGDFLSDSSCVATTQAVIVWAEDILT
jgi:hypothetical protein